MYTIVPVAFLTPLLCWHNPETTDATLELEAKGRDHGPSHGQCSCSLKYSPDPTVPGHRKQIQKCLRLEIFYCFQCHSGLLKAHAVVSGQDHKEEWELDQAVTQRWSVRKLIPGWGHPPPDQDSSSSSLATELLGLRHVSPCRDTAHGPVSRPSCPKSHSFHIWLVNGRII